MYGESPDPNVVEPAKIITFTLYQGVFFVGIGFPYMKGERGLSTEDFQELKEVIMEFLSHYDYLHEYRLQKLVFYGELFCLQKYARRLTDASFIPHHYGCFSDDVRQALEELEDVERELEFRDGHETHKYLHYDPGGDLHPGKKELIKDIHEETKTLSNEQLAQVSKQSWLFRNTPKEEPMDFDFYRDQVIGSPEQTKEISERSNHGVKGSKTIEELLSFEG